MSDDGPRYGTILFAHETGTRHLVRSSRDDDDTPFNGPAEIHGDHHTACGRVFTGYGYSDPWLESNPESFGDAIEDCGQCAKAAPAEADQ